MSIDIRVERLTFTFPDDWRVQKFDDSVYYRQHFVKQLNSLKAVDLVVKAPDGFAYLIEVKDYRHPDTKKMKPSELADAISWKVLVTLAALLPAKFRASNIDEQSHAKAILSCTDFRVIAHIETPQAHLPVIDPADIKQKLRQRLAAVDSHLKVVSSAKMGSLAWSVRQ